MRWAMRSVSSRRKITQTCVRSSVSSAAGSSGKRRKVSITIRLRRREMKGEGATVGNLHRNLSRDYREILRVEAAKRRTDKKSDGVSGMRHPTIVRPADLIEGTGD